jgi:phosphoglycolate phosphatase-like HAD superfamily hydrolase
MTIPVAFIALVWKSASSTKIEKGQTQVNNKLKMPEVHQENPLSRAPIKALIFDLMGTCLDWHSTVSPILNDAFSSSNHIGPSSPNALAWRQRFFNEIHRRFEAGLPQEDIDETHRRTLLALLHSEGWTMEFDKVEACVKAWHSQKGKSYL